MVEATTSGSAPASTSAAIVMSPATPAWQLNHAIRCPLWGDGPDFVSVNASAT